MATLELSARRLIIAGGFALAVATAPAIAVVTMPSGSVPLACPSGEEEDIYTGECLPHTVPNSPLTSIAGNPSLPAVNLPGGGGSIPCTGANSGQCIGLAESEAGAAQVQMPNTTVQQSP
jgi:hypothetical protein